MSLIRPDPMGALDILVAGMLFYTVSPLPAVFAASHAFFLFGKGVGSIIQPIHMPLPVFIMGGAADVISAAILLTGNPPVLAEYKIWIAGALFLKGIWTLLSFMNS